MRALNLFTGHNDQAHRQQWSAAELLSVCSASLAALPILWLIYCRQIQVDGIPILQMTILNMSTETRQ
jgi:hypothetical protein